MSNFEIKGSDAVTQVLLRDKLTASEVPFLQDALKKELSSGVKEVVFDFSQVQVIDSTGMGLLVATYNTMSQKNGSVRLNHVSPEIMGLLKSMRLAERLNAREREAENG